MEKDLDVKIEPIFAIVPLDISIKSLSDQEKKIKSFFKDSIMLKIKI